MENDKSTNVRQKIFGLLTNEFKQYPTGNQGSGGEGGKIFSMKTWSYQEFRKYSVKHVLDERTETVHNRKLFLKISMVYALQANSVSY